MEAASPTSFFTRHEFLIRRLHSLSGLIPVGAYLCIHLLTNASVLAGPDVFQRNVDQIHSLDLLLPVVEWAFIFLPILFHGIVGVVIMAGWVPNTSHYPYQKNYRYFLQRVTGMIAFVFIFFHVFHLHHYGELLFGDTQIAGYRFGQFDPHAASSSTAIALQPTWVQAVYAIGVLASVYHLANGLWTMGITWGIWVSPAAQRRADYICTAFGVLVAVIGLSALYGMRGVDINQAKAYEARHREMQEKVLVGEAAVENEDSKHSPETE